jgi:hypothetical protein
MLEKKFTYRGADELFGNTYHFDGGSPASPTRWKDFADIVASVEKGIFNPSVSIVRAVGYDAGNPIAAWSYDYEAHAESIVGTLVPGADDVLSAGDAAVWIRYGTTQLNSRGKPIYLRNYYHNAWHDKFVATIDNVSAAQLAGMDAFGAAWVAGFSDGSAYHHRAGPNGAVAQNYLSGIYVTTRTLKRRG